jgi:MYXO-CTERM domain-containing protein
MIERVRRALVAILLVGSLSSACDDSPEATSRRELAIIDGTPAPDDVAVVGLGHRVVTCTEHPWFIECTGTLVAPRVVVTAAHCLGVDPPNALQAFFGASFADGGVAIPVVGGRVHPQYDPVTHANDIAVLILETAAPATIAPIPLRTTPLPDLTGTTVRMVGFGITSTTGNETGVRLAGDARVSEVGAEMVTMVPDPAMSCHGDSGGPVLADTGAGEQLIGVTSYGDPACKQFGVAVRVDRQLAFIQSLIDEAEAAMPQRPFDPDELLCNTPCDVDADCPAETVCFSYEGQPRFCSYRGLPAADYITACSAGENCDLPCVAMPDGSCRRHVPCELAVDTCEPVADPGCGCKTGTPRGGGAALGALVLLFLVRRRHHHRSKRSRFRASWS